MYSSLQAGQCHFREFQSEYVTLLHLHGRRSAGFKTDTKPSDGRQLSDSGAARARTVVAAD